MAESGWHLKEHGSAGADVSAQFFEFLDRIRTSKPVLPEEAKSLVILLVPGLFTEHYPGYMNDNMAHLTKLGLSVHKAALDTDVGVAANAARVRDAVLHAAAEGKRVVIVGHSKGGVDAAHAIGERGDSGSALCC
jgi:triacylglycerol lipase